MDLRDRIAMLEERLDKIAVAAKEIDKERKHFQIALHALYKHLVKLYYERKGIRQHQDSDNNE